MIDLLTNRKIYFLQCLTIFCLFIAQPSFAQTITFKGTIQGKWQGTNIIHMGNMTTGVADSAIIKMVNLN